MIMPDYTKEELAHLIEQYNRQMISQYRDTQPTVQVTVADDPPSPRNENAVRDDTALTDIGQLQIRVSTENQVFPIEGAVVTVTHSHNADTLLDRVLITDQNGLTPIIDLPTKDRTLSLSPDNPTPYTTYNVRVTTDGYFTKDFLNLPIYGGVTAVQSVSMIPLPEGGGDDIPLVIVNNEANEE